MPILNSNKYHNENVISDPKSSATIKVIGMRNQRVTSAKEMEDNSFIQSYARLKC